MHPLDGDSPIPPWWVGRCPSTRGSKYENDGHQYASNANSSHFESRRPQPHTVEFLLQEGVFFASWLGITPQVATHTRRKLVHTDNMMPIYLFERKSSPPGVRSRLPESASGQNTALMGTVRVRIGFAHSEAVRCDFENRGVFIFLRMFVV
jgi:hypothetical protein